MISYNILEEITIHMCTCVLHLIKNHHKIQYSQFIHTVMLTVAKISLLQYQGSKFFHLLKKIPRIQLIFFSILSIVCNKNLNLQ